MEQNPKLLGATVWDAAIVFLKFLDNEKNFLPNYFLGKKTIDIGSGTGLVGIVAALLGANVICTDLPEYVSLMKSNIQKNSAELLRRNVKRSITSRISNPSNLENNNNNSQNTVVGLNKQIQVDELFW